MVSSNNNLRVNYTYSPMEFRNQLLPKKEKHKLILGLDKFHQFTILISTINKNTENNERKNKEKKDRRKTQ